MRDATAHPSTDDSRATRIGAAGTRCAQRNPLPLLSGRSPGRSEERPAHLSASDARATRSVAYIASEDAR